MDEKNEKTVETTPTPKKVRDGNALKQAMSRTGGASIGQFRAMPNRSITFDMDHTVCRPDLFQDDFEITLLGLDPDMELKAASKAKGDPTQLVNWYGYFSLAKVNGAEIDDSIGERDWLWHALGTGGRQLVAGMFATYFGAGQEAQGKALSSVRIG